LLLWSFWVNFVHEMKTAASILFLLTVLIQPLSRLAIYASFQFNREYIARNLCDEREIPQSTCNGSCQLVRQLKEQDEKEQEIPMSINLKELTLFDKDNRENFYCVNSGTSNSTCFYLKEESTRDFKASIFHPPKNHGI
jgi:hypothetical protein